MLPSRGLQNLFKEEILRHRFVEVGSVTTCHVDDRVGGVTYSMTYSL